MIIVLLYNFRAERYRSVFSLVMFDIDHFRSFNNQYGYPAGDQVLHDVVAQLVRHSIRKSDLLFRYGGEEFAIILPETTLENAVIMTEKIRKIVENLILHHNG
jgi:diguanylate cyclase (GGDEF)-like protein